MLGIVRMDGRSRMAVGELGRHRLAEDDARGGADQRNAGRVGKGPMVGVDRRAVSGRHVDRVDDVLDPDRSAGEQTLALGAVDRPGLRDRLFRVEPCPGLDFGAGAGLLKAGAGRPFGGQCAGRQLGDRLGGGQTLGTVHQRSPSQSRCSTQSATWSRGSSACRRATN